MISIRRFTPTEWGIESTSYSAMVHAECTATPGMRFLGPRRAWGGYVDAVDAAARRLVAKGVKLDLSPLPEPGKIEGIVLPPIATGDLRDYQKVGVEFMVAHAATGVFNADAVGLGKTLQAIRTARALRGKTLIVSPAFLKGVWVTGLNGDKMLTPPTPAGWPGVKCQVLAGTKPDKTPIDPDVHVLIINYDVLHAWVDTLIAWQPVTIIFDEAHVMMSDRARRTRSAEQIARATPNRVLLSATPITSRPRDLWAPLQVMSAWRFGTPFPYYKHHAAAFQEQVTPERIAWNTKGASNLDELKRRLSFFMVRRTPSDVKLELPSRQRQVIEVDVQRKYTIALAIALKNEDSLRRALDMAADGKLSDVVSLVAGHVAAGSKVVVGTWRKAVAEVLATTLREAGFEARVITGDVSRKTRDEILRKKPQIICATLDSMGMGLDLTFANVGVCAELPYVPSKLVQWEGRMYRFRQTLPTLFQYVIARGTADELVRATCIDKLHLFEQGIGKQDDSLLEDLDAREKTPVEVLRGLYERIKAGQTAPIEEW